MFNIIIISILIGHVSAFSLSNESRIVGGTNAKTGEIPYIVSVRIYTDHTCGGSILDPLNILTAAHCVEKSSPTRFTVQYGVLKITSNSAQSIQVKNIFIHERYSPGKNYANDIAVLRLESAIPLGQNVKAVQLPTQNEDPPANGRAVLAGWGLSKTGGSVMKDLQRVDIVVYSDSDCTKAHGTNVNSLYHVCAGVPEGGKGQCSKDSGGPLVSNGLQVGIVSWSEKPCAGKGSPGVLTRVARYVTWIKQKMKV